ncbi:MAG: hypothetical protein RBU25_06300 [Lentisphaeria bacterium]|jgi:hypothetical protein|nr:hypothetical protein [Lentisphaeria bacterium]
MSSPLLLHLDPCDARALAEILGARGGRELDLDEAHELLETLLDLREAEAGRSRTPVQDGLLFRTIAVGGELLHSPTLAARLALQRLDRWPVPPDWTAHAQEWVSLCVGWILAHGRQPEALETLDSRTVQPLVEAWAARLACTAAELSAAVADLAGSGYPPLDPDTPERKKALAGPTTPPSSSAWPKPATAAPPTTGFIRFLKRICTGCAAPWRSATANSNSVSTPNASTPTTPASRPANAGRPSAAS